MKSLERMVVGLSADPTDAGLVDYAFLLAKLGVATHLDFVHVVAPHRAKENPEWAGEVRHVLEKAVGGMQTDSTLSLDISFNVLVGEREDQFCNYLETKSVGVILLGHRVHHSSGKRSLARRLAMVSPASAWIVPEKSAPQIRKILSPVDFSSHSADSLSMATGIASKAGLKTCDGLHVFYDSTVMRYDDHSAFSQEQESAAFDRFVRPLNTHGVAVEPLFVEGSNVARTILGVATERQHDLIVVSTRGRTLAASVLLGSETCQVIMETQVPVLAVKHCGARMNLLQALMSDKLWNDNSKDVHT